jgi:hypothetical protein
LVGADVHGRDTQRGLLRHVPSDLEQEHRWTINIDS